MRQLLLSSSNPSLWSRNQTNVSHHLCRTHRWALKTPPQTDAFCSQGSEGHWKYHPGSVLGAPSEWHPRTPILHGVRTRPPWSCWTTAFWSTVCQCAYETRSVYPVEYSHRPCKNHWLVEESSLSGSHSQGPCEFEQGAFSLNPHPHSRCRDEVFQSASEFNVRSQGRRPRPRRPHVCGRRSRATRRGKRRRTRQCWQGRSWRESSCFETNHFGM